MDTNRNFFPEQKAMTQANSFSSKTASESWYHLHKGSDKCYVAWWI